MEAALTARGFQKLREHAVDGSGIYRQAVGGLLRDLGTPATDAEWSSLKDTARRELGGLRDFEVDEKMLDMVISEQKGHVPTSD